MDINEIKNKYNQVCFSLKQKEEELEKLKVDIFILNPKMKELTNEICKLYAEKLELRKKLEENK